MTDFVQLGPEPSKPGGFDQVDCLQDERVTSTIQAIMRATVTTDQTDRIGGRILVAVGERLPDGHGARDPVLALVRAAVTAVPRLTVNIVARQFVRVAERITLIAYGARDPIRAIVRGEVTEEDGAVRIEARQLVALGEKVALDESRFIVRDPVKVIARAAVTDTDRAIMIPARILAEVGERAALTQTFVVRDQTKALARAEVSETSRAVLIPARILAEVGERIDLTKHFRFVARDPLKAIVRAGVTEESRAVRVAARQLVQVGERAVFTNPPTIGSFSAAHATICAGASTALRWSVTNATSVSISGGVGSVANSGTVTVRPNATTTYTLTATNTSGSTTKTVTVWVTPLPVIQQFFANFTEICEGSSATLTWRVTGADSVSISGIGIVGSSGSRSVSPTVATSYVLTATKGTCQVQSSVGVTVGSGPTINAFSAGDTSICKGSSTALSWRVTGADSVSISGIGTVGSSGSRSVSPNATTTYLLTATNDCETVTRSVTVTVGDKPVISSFSADDTSICSGDSTNLRWRVSNATSISISGIGTVAGSSRTVSPTVSTTYVLTATNACGSVTASVTIAVGTKPVIGTFSADDTDICSGNSTILRWNIAGATSVSISGIGSVPATGTRSVSPNATRIYVLTATNDCGSVTASVTIAVGSAPTINSFAADDGQVCAGSSTVLRWNVSGATSVSISGIGTVSRNGSRTITPSAQTTYTLTARNDCGTATRSVTVLIGTKPTIPSFTVDAAKICSGSSTTLRWSVSNATSISISGIGAVTGSSRAVSPTATTTYVLTATNTCGSVTKSVTVTVVSGVPVISSFTASPDLICSDQLTPEIGGYETILRWSVRDADSVSIDQGIGDVSGTSSATDTVTATRTYTLTATNLCGTSTRRVKVTVQRDPFIAGFHWFSSTGKYLQWSTQHATAVTLNGTPVDSSETRYAIPDTTEATTYTLVASNVCASVTRQVTVPGSDTPPPGNGDNGF